MGRHKVTGHSTLQNIDLRAVTCTFVIYDVATRILRVHATHEQRLTVWLHRAATRSYCCCCCMLYCTGGVSTSQSKLRLGDTLYVVLLTHNLRFLGGIARSDRDILSVSCRFPYTYIPHHGIPHTPAYMMSGRHYCTSTPQVQHPATSAYLSIPGAKCAFSNAPSYY